MLSNYRADRNATSSAAVDISDIRQPTRGRGALGRLAHDDEDETED